MKLHSFYPGVLFVTDEYLRHGGPITDDMIEQSRRYARLQLNIISAESRVREVIDSLVDDAHAGLKIAIERARYENNVAASRAMGYIYAISTYHQARLDTV